METDTTQRGQGLPAEHGSPPAWGEMLRFTTDDDDTSKLQLCISQGGNGDWYVSIADGPAHYPTKAVRIRTSGGASMSVPGLGQGIAKAYRALFDSANGGGEVGPPEGVHSPPLCCPVATEPRKDMNNSQMIEEEGGESTSPPPLPGRRGACHKCGDALRGHEDENQTHCRWCVTGWVACDSESVATEWRSDPGNTYSGTDVP